MAEQNKQYLIYKHVNKINSKVYIGQTCLKLNARWGLNGSKYERYVVASNNDKIPSHFWSAIQKYGWDNFEHKVLIHGLTKEQADRWEKRLIKQWDLMNPQRGYNKQCGGSHGEMSDITKNKMSKSHIGKKLSEDTIKKLTGENNHFYGKHHTEESRKKMSESQRKIYEQGHTPWNKGKKCPQLSGGNNPRAKKVMRLSDNRIYTSMQECAIDNNLARDTVIQHCLNRVQNPKFSYFNIDIN